jgi:hypothetical protein
MCAHRPPALFPAGADRAAIKADFEAEPYFGAGWHDSERTPTGRVRRVDDRATLLLPLTTGDSYQISLDLVAATPTRIDVTLNGAAVGGCDLGGQGRSCDVTLSSGMARDGVNALTLTAVRSPSQAASPLIFQGARILRRSAQR